MTFLNKQSFTTFPVFFYSLIFKRLSTQLNGNSYKEPLRYLILVEAFNAGFPYFMSTQRVHKLLSLVKRSETRLPSVSASIDLGRGITNVQNQAR